jgi:hypothetical protein
MTNQSRPHHALAFERKTTPHRLLTCLSMEQEKGNIPGMCSEDAWNRKLQSSKYNARCIIVDNDQLVSNRFIQTLFEDEIKVILCVI